MRVRVSHGRNRIRDLGGAILLAGVLLLPPRGLRTPNCNVLVPGSHGQTPAFVKHLNPGAIANILDPKVTKSDWADYFEGRCFPEQWGEPNNSLQEGKHPLYRDGAPTPFQGEIAPEIGALNVTLDDLRDSGRVIARIVITKSSGLATEFKPRHLKVGTNYLYLYSDPGTRKPWLIVFHKVGTSWDHGTPYEVGSTFVDGGKTYTNFTLTVHGHRPANPLQVFPGFSDATSKCELDFGRRACLLDTPFTHSLAAIKDPQERARLVAKVQMIGRDMSTSGTWVKMNGVCFCQGDGCH